LPLTHCLKINPCDEIDIRVFLIMYINGMLSIYRINLDIDRNNDEMLHVQTEDFEKRCFYFSHSIIAVRKKTARRWNGNYAGTSTSRAEVGKIPERSMLMAESEIKRPRGHSSGKVQSPKFGHLPLLLDHLSDPLRDAAPGLSEHFSQEWGSRGCTIREFAVKEMNNKYAALF